MACRLKTSCQHHVPSSGNPCWPQRGRLGSIRDTAGFRRHHRDLNEMTVVTWLPRRSAELGGGASIHGCAGPAGTSGAASSSAPRAATPAVASPMTWWILTNMPTRPSASPGSSHTCHSGRDRGRPPTAAGPALAWAHTPVAETGAPGAAGLRSPPGPPRSARGRPGRLGRCRPGWPARRCPAARSHRATACAGLRRSACPPATPLVPRPASGTVRGAGQGRPARRHGPIVSFPRACAGVLGLQATLASSASQASQSALASPIGPPGRSSGYRPPPR